MGDYYVSEYGDCFERHTGFCDCLDEYFVLACLLRNLWKWTLRKRRTGAGNVKKTVLITTGDRAEAVVRNLVEQGVPEGKLAGVAIYDYSLSDLGEDTGKNREKSILGIPVVAGSGGIIPYLTHEWVDEVFLDLNEMMAGYRDLSDRLMETGIVIHRRIGECEEYLGREKQVQYVGGYPVVTVGIKFLSPRQAFEKRALDILFGIAGCVATLLLTIVIGPIIFIKSPGLIFFSQVRIGRNGKRFRMYKFRSMYPDAESRKHELSEENRHSDGMMFKVDQDPRIIGSRRKPGKGIGYFIRRTSIDEFPQFFNVLIGNIVHNRKELAEAVLDHDLL